MKSDVTKIELNCIEDGHSFSMPVLKVHAPQGTFETGVFPSRSSFSVDQKSRQVECFRCPDHAEYQPLEDLSQATEGTLLSALGSPYLYDLEEGYPRRYIVNELFKRAELLIEFTFYPLILNDGDSNFLFGYGKDDKGPFVVTENESTWRPSGDSLFPQILAGLPRWLEEFLPKTLRIKS